MGAEGREDEQALDPRHVWLMRRIGVAFKLKYQDLRKMMEPDSDNGQAAKVFCDTGDTGVLYVCQRGTQIVLSVTPPADMVKQKKKVMYFMKLMEGSRTPKIDLAVMHKQLVMGDVSSQPLETLNKYMSNVFLPMIQHEDNIAEVVDVAQPALMESAHTCFSQILVTNGLADGRTILPFPQREFPTKVDKPIRDKDLLYLLESVVVKWTVQIKAAMEVEPGGMALQSGCYPGPLEEVQFWKSKRDNLMSLEQQLNSNKAMKLRIMLDKVQSSYFRPFRELMRDLRGATEEAADNFRFLEPVSDVFMTIKDATDEASFGRLATEDTFSRLFHHFFVIWTTSRCYNAPSRLVVLIKEVCNDLISVAMTTVNVEDLFSIDCDDAAKRLSTILLVCGQFKDAYFQYKTKAGKVGRKDKPPRPWKFQNTTLFFRLDAFLERCHDVLDVLGTVMLFRRLEKLEIGGTRGAERSHQVLAIHEQFNQVYEEFYAPSDYSTDAILDIDERGFDENFQRFAKQVSVFEKHLGSVLVQCIDDSRSLTSVFKIVDTYEGFLDRHLIQQEWQGKQAGILQTYQTDLLEVQECFRLSKDTIQIEGANLYFSMPPAVIQLVWARGLLDRICDPYPKLMDLTKNLTSTELLSEVVQLYDSLCGCIKGYIAECYERWSAKVGRISTEKLKFNLLTQDQSIGLMKVNFDVELDKLLRDVNYLQILNSYDSMEEKLLVPPNALQLFKRRHQFRSQRLKLEAIVSTYNEITTTILDVERPMLVVEIQHCEQELQRGMTKLNWNSPDIDEYIEATTLSVTDLDAVLKSLSQNAKEMRHQIVEFTYADKSLPLHPKENKTLSLDEYLKKYNDNKHARQANLSNIGVKVHELMAASLECINTMKTKKGIQPLDTDTECWIAYVGYANGIVMDAMTKAVVQSLKNLRDQLDPQWLRTNDGIPLLDIKFVLYTQDSYSAPTARFVPGLRSGNGTQGGSYLTDESSLMDTNLFLVVNEWVQDCIEYAQFVTRLDALPGSDESYVDDVQMAHEVMVLSREITELVEQNVDEWLRFEGKYLSFSALWEDDIEKSFRSFMMAKPQDVDDGQEDTTGDDTALAETAASAAGLPKDASEEFFGVPLTRFNEKICHFKKVLKMVEDLPTSTTIGWLRTDSKPIIMTLTTYAKKWIAKYVDFIVQRIGSSLQELNEFMAHADQGLDEEITDDDEDALRRVLKHIRDCKVRDASTKAMFEPISSGLKILRQHGGLVDDKVVQNLDEMRRDAPDQWKELDKKYRTVRKANNARQELQGEQLKDRAQAMEDAVAEFRITFKNMRSFFYQGMTVEEAYADIVHWNAQLCQREHQAGELNGLLELFEKQVTDLPELKECRQELMLLKQLWDMVAHVKSQFTDWYQLTFKLLDPDELSTRTKDMLKQLKGMALKCKLTNTYAGLEAEIKSMLVTLPLVENLRNPAMRERHWKQLLKKCKFDANKVDPESDSFSLQDLLSLQLHQYTEDVDTIVEKAQKELQIERGLEKVLGYWENEAMFEYQWSDALDSYLLCPVDNIVEVLEEHLNSLQSMMSNRFIDEFAEQVSRWQRHLGTVETCMSKWIELQKMWKNLYPIFIESVDIREQLQEDSRAFQAADELYRALMNKAHNYTSVIEVCCTDLLQRQLDRDDDFETLLTSISETLIMCQKKLREYLEGKKKLFARFFFLSNTDLIDILSKGSDPVAVMRHMSKLIDSVRSYSFVPETKRAHEIVSVQGEKIDLCEQYTCDGPVEEWLRSCVDVMFRTIKQSILDGYTTYMESSRTEWVMNKGYPCQTVVVGSRIWFTQEAEEAFAQLEDGHETALKDFFKQQETQIHSLIHLVLSELTANERAMLVHLITIDVHARDVIGWIVEEKAESRDTFTWQSQLRYSWDEKRGSVIDICDASFVNGYEYIGICGCLVITKLTDRCYITLSQALRLIKGGAPAGPAGTGKTETTKDLARNLGIACYVFNCSDQMDVLSLGQIFKGLAMSGSWGCFDEFNRIPIQVLSVVATQVGSILNALKLQKTHFRFMDEEISLVPKVGMWITMNPGYAGRTELPENIKSLFRPCAMCVPDLKNICEIMLAAEGFVDAKDLALKFVTLYRLNKELLSKQAHYDWGLRAVKSVLYIAGALKRNDPDVSERAVLLRALRDTNKAKLSRDDVTVFSGLIKALFPALEVPPKVNPCLNDACKEACSQRKLFCGENDIFILRCVQYAELLDVRHSVFVMGPAGCGKSECWKTLAKAFRLMGNNCDYKVMNPKAVTSDELYGYIHPQTREWKDGLLSNLFREYAEQSQTKDNSKWLVLDGIIDAEWIESMNTVMDDNKMLTLASNERIPLTKSMRMIFEISDLKNASPATVSRAGIIYINDTDLGWQPFKDKWIAAREDERERTCLDGFFDKYIPVVMEWYKRSMRPPIALVDLAIVQTVCHLLEGLCCPKYLPPGSGSELYEKYFIFACVWAFGGPLSSDGRIDYRSSFSNWWKKEWPGVKVEDPEVATDRQNVFDVFLTENGDYSMWSNIVPKYKHDADRPFADICIETVETTRLSFLLNILADNRKAVLFVGTAGTGKTTICSNSLARMDQTKCISQLIAFNAMTRPRMLQQIMEQKLEKKAGKMFGPPGKKRLVYFIDDINMPTPDKYGTQEATEFIRQHVDYSFWYDRVKPGFPLKEISKCQYVAAMNPKSGTFTILDRLLRHFGVFTCSMPEDGDLRLIYGSSLKGHLNRWSRNTQAMAEKLTNATIRLHKSVGKQFLPTAVKFHYQWNLRELFNIFQGLSNANLVVHDSPIALTRLWLHECSRTFRDRMTNDTDIDALDDLTMQLLRDKEIFGEDVNMDEVLQEPNIWAPFGVDKDGNEGVLRDMGSFSELYDYLQGRLEEYNDLHPAMNLVLFDDAMQHICRVCRVMNNPRGNAMLVGVGGSGKQSLSRLAAYICGFEKFQVVVTATYGLTNFKEDLQHLYHRCGQKNQQYAFLITDGQIVTKEMLVYLNDLLSSGNIPDLFPQEDMESIQGSMVGEAKAAGLQELTPSNLWAFFINKVRANLHTVLCFSPVGQQLATWCREFPALANTTVIDWFHPWPKQALVSVATRFLADVDLCDNIEGIAEHMAFVHESVTERSQLFLAEEKRFCYTTPKSFLELISFYKELLHKKRVALDNDKMRLSNGIDKIMQAADQVAGLQEKLKKEQVIVAQKGEVSQKLMAHVEKEKDVVGAEQEKAEVEENKTNVVFQEAQVLEADCKRDLEAAKPIVEEALAALNSLVKGDLTELKALGKPPPDVEMVAVAVMCLTADPKHIPPRKNRDWSNAKKMMANVDRWMVSLKEYDANKIPQACVDAIQEYIKDPSFKPELVKTKSQAASGLCAWVVNMNKYHTIRCDVKPKEEKLAEAQEKLARSKTDLKKVQDRVAELKSKLAGLVKQFDEAVEDTRQIETQARKTQEKANLAERLVGGLAGEKLRWGKTIDELDNKMALLIGDVLLAAAFVSYIGPFSKKFRESIYAEDWLPDISERQIPHTAGLDVVMRILTSEAEVAGWQNDELKSDRLSTENGALVTNCKRWPLLIDPQLQGVKWIKTREAGALQVCQLTQKNYIHTVIRCLTEGLPCLIEKVGESIDPILEPILGRMVIKKESRLYMRVGDKDVEYDPNFKLYLQTRMPNPHYKPEINAQATLINFTVTSEGLEDQLLAVVVNRERPDLEESRVTLLRKTNQMTIDLEMCEENLLQALSQATGDILENVALVVQLETTKKKASDIEKSMQEAQVMQAEIAENRRAYTTVAIRGSLLFFQIDQLATISHMYQYSLGAYMQIFQKALTRAEQPSEEDGDYLPARCAKLTDSITKTIYAFCSRGLFERHKLIFSSLLCFSILLKEGEIDQKQLNYLLRCPRKFGVEMPANVKTWLSESCWAAVQALREVEGTTPPFSQLDKDLEESNRWQKWCEIERPEDRDEGRLPTDWKHLKAFQRLLVLRALRPDRLVVGLTNFVADSMGRFFVEDKAVPLRESFEDSGPATPVFFILSPGVDPGQFVMAMGAELGYTEEEETMFNVSLGQGQEPRAFAALEHCFAEGGWAMLNNIHLVELFCKELEKRLDVYEEHYTKRAAYLKLRREKKLALKSLRRKSQVSASAVAAAAAAADDSDPPVLDEADVEVTIDDTPTPPSEKPIPRRSITDDAIFAMCAEDDDDPEIELELDDDPELQWEGDVGSTSFRVFLSAEPSPSIPIGILQRSIKLTNEPPSGIQANMVRALSNFTHEPWENSQKPGEYKAVVFAMCYFHAVVIERKKYGAQGWNRAYPFNVGDLTTCVEVFNNYEERPKVPWDDLRYVFGEIMYGGHITDDWDRVLCMAYLENMIHAGVSEELELAPGLVVPQFGNYAEALEVMKHGIPPETPLLYGLHPNAEIGYRTLQAEMLFATINELQPRQEGAVGLDPAEEVKLKVDELMNSLPEQHNLTDISERLDEDHTPQAHVFYQECERTNLLREKVLQALSELDLGLRGALSMSQPMQELYESILVDKVSPEWTKYSFMSTRPLGSWFQNFNDRNLQLCEWTSELITPRVTMINLFFNPMSFITAIMQDTAIRYTYDLDQMALITDVTKKWPEQIEYHAKDHGAHVCGMTMEGARWDHGQVSIEDSNPKELYCRIPVCTLRSLPLSKIDRKDQYECPLYRTQERGPGIVCGIHLKTKAPARRWTIAGVALLLDVVE